MAIFPFLLTGIATGWLASTLVDQNRYSMIKEILIGIVGALSGGYLLKIVGMNQFGYSGDFWMSVVFSVLLLAVVGILEGTDSFKDSLHRSS